MPSQPQSTVLPAPLRLHLLGTPLVEQAGATGPLPLERRTQLLVWAAVRGGWVTRAEIAALLWPEHPTRQALTNTRKALFRMQASPLGPALRLDGTAVRVEARTDIADFEAALAAGRSGDALAAWRGEPLAGFDDGLSEPWTRWLTEQRERLRGLWRGAVLAHAANPATDAAAAAALTASLVEADPLDEDALCAHHDTLLRNGQKAAARQAYRQFAERLFRELGIEPSAALRARHASIDGSTAAAPAPCVPPTTRVPPTDDGFVGRGIELQRLVDLLARPECRLLTLIGPGGVGKTRLARRVLGALGAAFDDGTVFVPAEAAMAPSQFGPRLLEALGVRGNAGLDALQTAVAALAGREQLIVVDNFEDLVPHAGSLLEPVLAASPKVKLLVTSRVRLSVASEWSMPLEGLPVPEPEDEDRAEAFDAVRLFVQSARRVELGFLLSDHVPAVVDICRQVEGLPLALELAAAWVRVLPPKVIAAELREGLDLLRASDPSQPPRHGSMELVFDESWRRLAQAERDALARLSVFRGGFTAAAARVVAGAALPVLRALGDKSLLRKDAGGERLSLHPLVQRLAADRLLAAGLQDATAAAHAAHFHRWLQGLRAGAADGDRQTLAAIDADFENVCEAWSQAIARGDAAALAASGSTLLDWAENRARFDSSLGLWLQALEALPATRETRGALALLAAQAARIEYRLARFSEAEADGRRALADTTARKAADREARHEALAVLGACAISLGRFDDARRLFEQALSVARAGTMVHEVAGTLENLALVAKRQGRYEESLALLLQALAEHRRIGDSASVALSLSNLGSMRMAMGDDEAAGDHLREALALAERNGLVSTRAFVLANLTELALRVADWKAARGHAERALDIARGSGLRPLAGWLELQLARLAARDGNLDAARRGLAEGAALAVALKAPSIAAAALLAWAELLEAQGQSLLAQRVLAFGLEQPQFSAPDREELRIEWARRAGIAETEAPVVPPWPQAISVELLLGRLVAERDTSYAALIRSLR